MLQLHGCQRCKGTLTDEYESAVGHFLVCINCGNEEYEKDSTDEVFRVKVRQEYTRTFKFRDSG